MWYRLDLRLLTKDSIRGTSSRTINTGKLVPSIRKVWLCLETLWLGPVQVYRAAAHGHLAVVEKVLYRNNSKFVISMYPDISHALEYMTRL